MLPVVFCSSRIRFRCCLALSSMAYGLMPKGIWLPEHASCYRWLVMVLLLSMALQRMEPEMDGGGSSASPLNKLEFSSDLRNLGSSSLWYTHCGDGGYQKEGFLPCLRSVLRDSVAASSLRSSIAVDPRRPVPSCHCFFWPKGGPPQPQDGGCSSSRLHADAEDLRLCPNASQRRCPKWFVPGDGFAGSGVEFIRSLRWRRTQSRFPVCLQGPYCKTVGPGCNFVFCLDRCVTCKPTAGI